MEGREECTGGQLGMTVDVLHKVTASDAGSLEAARGRSRPTKLPLMQISDAPPSRYHEGDGEWEPNDPQRHGSSVCGDGAHEMQYEEEGMDQSSAPGH